MTWLAYALVIFLTALVTILGTAWLTGRDGCVATEQPRERKRSGGNENADRWHLPRAGYLPGPPFARAADPGQYEVPGPIPWDLAGAAYQLGQMRASQDDITRQVDAIMAEVELHPERWRR